MNLPNLLTIFRILLIPFFLNFMIYGYTEYALITFLVAGITDAVDGAVARLTNTKTELGAVLDPLADKMLAVAAFVALTVIGRLPVWLTLTVIFRDVVIVMGSTVIYLLGYDIKIRPMLIGKITTFVQLTLLAVMLISVYVGRDFAVAVPLIWLTLAFTIGSGLQYIVRGFKIVGGDENA